MSGKPGAQRNAAPIQCSVCGTTFTPYRATQVTCSRSCNARQPHIMATTQANRMRPEVRERKNAARNQRYASDPSRRIQSMDAQLRRNYGINFGDYSRMLGEQNGLCAICGGPPVGGKKSNARLHVDHDHVTGAVRGLLCNRCNLGIGYFADDLGRLLAAIDYLIKHKEGTR